MFKAFVLTLFTSILFSLLVSLVFAVPVWIIWDCFVAKHFCIKVLTYGQSVLLTFMCRCLAAETKLEIKKSY